MLGNTPRTDALYAAMPSTMDTALDADNARRLGDLCRELEREVRDVKVERGELALKLAAAQIHAGVLRQATALRPSLVTFKVDEWEKQYKFHGAQNARWANAYHDLLAFARQLERVAGPLQAKLDRLMLEYCPEEMSKEQMEEWAKHQVPAGPEAEARLNAALSPRVAQEPASYTAGRQREADAAMVYRLEKMTADELYSLGIEGPWTAFTYAADLLKKNALVAAPLSHTEPRHADLMTVRENLLLVDGFLQSVVDRFTTHEEYKAARKNLASAFQATIEQPQKGPHGEGDGGEQTPLASEARRGVSATGSDVGHAAPGSGSIDPSMKIYSDDQIADLLGIEVTRIESRNEAKPDGYRISGMLGREIVRLMRECERRLSARSSSAAMLTGEEAQDAYCDALTYRSTFNVNGLMAVAKAQLAKSERLSATVAPTVFKWPQAFECRARESSGEFRSNGITATHYTCHTCGAQTDIDGKLVCKFGAAVDVRATAK